MRIFPVLGNHDAFPKSQFPSNHSAGDLYEEVGDVWKDFLQPIGAYDSFKTKGKVSEKKELSQVATFTLCMRLMQLIYSEIR